MFVQQIVLEHKEAIAPEPSDLLHELLDDLGDVPDMESLIGKIHVLCILFLNVLLQTPKLVLKTTAFYMNFYIFI